MVGRAPRVVVSASAAVVLAAVLAGSASADTVLLERSAVPMRVGTRLEYFTDQRHNFVATYTSEVLIVELDTSDEGRIERVSFRWRMYGASNMPKFDERGTIDVVAFDSGRALNGWWTGGKRVTSTDTHVWLGGQACRELRTRGETRFALDRSVRHDGLLRLVRVGREIRSIDVDGEILEVAVMKIESERGDRLTLLDDGECAHPLLVEADIVGLYGFSLRRVRTGVSPDIDGGLP